MKVQIHPKFQILNSLSPLAALGAKCITALRDMLLGLQVDYASDQDCLSLCN